MQKTLDCRENGTVPLAPRKLETGMLKVDPLVTHRFPLSRALDAFAVACSKDQNGAIKIVIDCQS